MTLKNHDLSQPLLTPEIFKSIKQFTKPYPLIYWTDLVLCTVICWYCVFQASLQNDSTLYIYAWVASIFLYRGTSFIHEVAHSASMIPYFELGYNILFGFMVKYPSYIYHPHLYHHSLQTYGTTHDPEYLTGEKLGGFRLISPFWLILFLPIAQIIRYIILPPFYFLISNELKLKIFKRYSTLALNPYYTRELKNDSELKQMYFQDLMCSFYGLIFFALIYFNILKTQILFTYWLAFSVATLLNMYRAKVNHRYFNDLEPTGHSEQVIDSTTLKRGIWTEIWAPLGLGYHALHHWLPSLPYHQMGKVHRILIKNLPTDHPYLKTNVSSFLGGLKQHFKDTRKLL